MALILALLFFFFFLPITAWAYFDPGFGGYLVNGIISGIVAGFAFVSAAAIYFFRTFIGQKVFPLVKKHQRLCIIVLLCILTLGSAAMGAFFCKSLTQDLYLPGSRIIDSQHMFKGYNLYEGKLIDERGQIVKSWSRGILGVIDTNGDYYAASRDDSRKDLEGTGRFWGRYTWDGRAVWEKHFLIHHELYLSPKGTIFTFTREIHDYNNYKVFFDVILEFDKNGKELQRYSFWDHLNEFKPYHAKFGIDVPFPAILLPLLRLWQYFYPPLDGGPYDYFHINSLVVIPPNRLEGKNPAFRPGNWLISIYHGSMVFILDQDTKKILWHAVGNEIEGGLEGQHSACMLPDGNILLFENGVNRRASRILMIDPLTLKIQWQYKNINFFSPTEGFVQALPNGNFLVTESRKGYVFELTSDKKIIWSCYVFRKTEHSFYRMTRYPKGMIDRFLQK